VLCFVTALSVYIPFNVLLLFFTLQKGICGVPFGHSCMQFRPYPRCTMVHIVQLRFHHYNITLSYFHHCTIQFSPLYHRLFSIVSSHFHHRTNAFSPLFHRVFTILPSRFHYRAIAFSPWYYRLFTIVPLLKVFLRHQLHSWIDLIDTQAECRFNNENSSTYHCA
jgi:hypothetical protein